MLTLVDKVSIFLLANKNRKLAGHGTIPSGCVGQSSFWVWSLCRTLPSTWRTKCRLSTKRCRWSLWPLSSMPVKFSLKLGRYLHHCQTDISVVRRPGGLTVPLSRSAGTGLLLCLQLLQPGDGEDGRDGAADWSSGPAHQCPADPAWWDPHSHYKAGLQLVLLVLIGFVVLRGDSAAMHWPGLVCPPTETRTSKHGTGVDPAYPGALAGHPATFHPGNSPF